MKKIKNILLIISVVSVCSCADYLDVVPDNVATIDHAFTNRAAAEKYLFTCYSYLPNPAEHNYNAGLMSGHECWVSTDGLGFFASDKNSAYAWNIARGYQNTNDPLLNYWDGGNGGNNLYIALRDCNIFLENIHKPGNLEQYERTRWIAEVKFLKAYYHFYLLRMYGPIPIIAENIPVSADPSTVRVYRDPVDKVAAYIVSLLDEAEKDLPLMIQDQTQEMGRITKPVAMALKAKTLMLVASPIFNGNPYYKNIKDNRGINLFSETVDKTKWETAALAIKNAIESAHEAGHQLYYYKGFNPVSDFTKAKLNIRCAFTERWNREIIWGSTKSCWYIQSVASARTNHNQFSSIIASMMSPSLEVAERFYSNNGVPIDEDKDYDYENRYKTSIVKSKDKYFMKEGFETANLHMNREVRFYASLSFDGCALYGNGMITDDPSTMAYTEMKKGKPGGMIAAEKYSVTGYLPKKLVSIESVAKETNWISYQYSFPYFRLADLYLMYAEALNETKASPDSEVFYWIDEVRKRASLEEVEKSWLNHSFNPEKVATQSGMREIIHRERLIELAFEGEAYWDLLRWREAEKVLNHQIKGWNVKGEDVADYYEVKLIATPSFGIKDYLFPIKQASLDKNPNLVQNPGWDGNY